MNRGKIVLKKGRVGSGNSKVILVSLLVAEISGNFPRPHVLKSKGCIVIVDQVHKV